MGRRYGGVVHVRLAEPEAEGPSAFVWRERLYVVREVLGHWRARSSWWEGAGGRALHGEVDAAPSAGVAAVSVLGADDEVWRVAASAGWRADVGTYDLSPGASGAWRMLRVVD
jgi:hypothetical protein